MAHTLKLSDGTTTVDFINSNIKLLEGGLDLGRPDLQPEIISSPFVDGDRLASARYGNRTITLKLKIAASSLSTLQTYVRSVNSLLNDAEKRRLLGYGTKVYLEYQWGVAASSSVYFDVLCGQLILPDNYQSVLLDPHYTILNATLTLNCKPFGRYTNQDIAQDTLENSQSTNLVQISYLTGDDNDGFTIYGADRWKGQSFTTIGAFTATKIMLKALRVGSPGDITAGIYATAAGAPTGAALASGTYSGNQLHTNTNLYASMVISMTTPVALSATTQYALVIKALSGDINNYVIWREDTSAPSHANGNEMYTTNAGGAWTQEAGTDCVFAIYGSETGKLNYQDITTDSTYGDIPAKMLIKLNASDETGTQEVYLAKRSGTRQTDTLWYDADNVSSFTNIIGGAHVIGGVKTYRANECDEQGYTCLLGTAGALAVSSQIVRFNYDIASPPRGRFRVLARCLVNNVDAAEWDHIGLGIGWSYGTQTYAPIVSEYHEVSAENTMELVDLGAISIPPLSESDFGTNGTYQLRIFAYSLEALSATTEFEIVICNIFLLPVDEGMIKVSVPVDVNLKADGISDPNAVITVDGSDIIQDTPVYDGSPFTLGRESTRIYVLRDDIKTVTFASDIKYQPQFNVV